MQLRPVSGITISSVSAGALPDVPGQVWAEDPVDRAALEGSAPPVSGPPPPEGEKALRRLRRLLDGYTGAREERKILELLSTAPPAVLDYLLENVDVPELLASMDDRVVGPDNKSALLTLLTKTRVECLGVPARARLIDGMQRGNTSPREERAVRELFTATRGADLTALKNAVDSGADHYDLHQLLYHDFDNPVYRAQVLSHFAEHSPARDETRLKAISDIDDTFYANWKDKRYPSETVYPGVLQFYKELDGRDRKGDLVFLTARPEERLGHVKDRAHQMLRARGVEEATVVAGSVLNLIGDEAIARKKFENFEEYAGFFPEYSFCFTGDSGQGDAILGARMLTEHPDKVRAVFIHDVVGLTPEQREEWRNQGVRLFDTYLGAALEAFDSGLIDRAAVERIADSVRVGLDGVAFQDPAQEAARRAEFELDLARMRELFAR